MDTHEFYTDSVTKKNNKKSKVEKERGLSSLAAAAVDAAREGWLRFLVKRMIMKMMDLMKWV
eukprot:scaffold37638_cov102-Skeletonema_marinoi.AAC.3